MILAAAHGNCQKPVARPRVNPYSVTAYIEVKPNDPRARIIQPMRLPLLLLLAGCLGLAGCASIPVYRPAQTANDYGYRTQALTDTRFRVSFAGGYRVARETVENLALFRAAQVALAHGAQRLRVISSDTQSVTERSGPVATVGYGSGGLFLGTGIVIARSYSDTRYQTVLVIEIGPGVPPRGPHVYDALQIKKHLAALANTAQN